MLMISSLTLLISILPLFVAAHLDPRFQDKNAFVTVPLVKARSNRRQNAITLERRSSSTKEILANSIPTIFRKKIGFINRLLPIKGRERLVWVNDAQYIGEITIGTPPQIFFVGFATDLNISLIGIPDPNPDPGALGPYKDKHVYRSAKSGTHVPDKARTYQIKGNPEAECGFRDTMTLGNIKIPHLYFKGTPSFDQSRPQEGTIALGFQGSENGAPSTFMDVALGKRQIKQKVFGVSLAPGNPELHFGGTNAQLYSNPIEFHKVILDNGKPVLSSWILENARVYVGDSNRPVLNGLKTIIVTDSLLTWGPRNEVKNFYKRIQGSKRVDRVGFKGLYEYPCTDRLKVKLSWGDSIVKWEYLGFDVPVNVTHLPKDSKMKKLMCYGSIGAYDPGTKMWEKLEGKWEIGTSFLRNLYAGFFDTDSEPKIMFGKLKLK